MENQIPEFDKIAYIKDNLEYPTPTKFYLVNGTIVEANAPSIQETLNKMDSLNNLRFFRFNIAHTSKYNGYSNIYINLDNIRSIETTKKDSEKYNVITLKGDWDLWVSSEAIGELQNTIDKYES